MRRVLAVTALPLVTIVALLVLAPMTPPGRAVIARLIERAASSDGLSVVIEHLSGWPPFSLGADRILVADADGMFAEIDGLDINVRVTALFAGKLAFKAIKAERVSVTRRPNVSAGAGGGTGLPFLVDEIIVSRLVLGGGLIGRPAELSLNGSIAGAPNSAFAAKVTAERIDGTFGSLTAMIKRGSVDTPLAIDLSLKEARDGVLVGLIGRQSGPAYSLDATATLENEGLSGEVSLSSEADAHFQGRFSFSSTDHAGRLALTGEGNLADLVPTDLADLLSGPIDLAIDADWKAVAGEALPRVVIRRGEFTTASVRASAEGTLAQSVADLSLSVEIDRPDGSAIALPFAGAGSRMERLSLSGTVAPSNDVIRLELVGRIAGLETRGVHVPGLGLSLAVETRNGDPLAGAPLPFAVRVEADAVETTSGKLVSTAQSPLVVTADGTFDTGSGVATTDAQMRVAGGTLAFSGTAAPDAVNGHATLHLADVAPLSPFVGRSISGAIDADFDGSLDARGANVSTVGTATGLDPGEATAARLLAGISHFQASVSARSFDAIEISDFVFDGAAVSATGALSLGDKTIHATLNAAITDLARLADTLSGSATLTYGASGAIEQPHNKGRHCGQGWHPRRPTDYRCGCQPRRLTDKRRLACSDDAARCGRGWAVLGNNRRHGFARRRPARIAESGYRGWTEPHCRLRRAHAARSANRSTDHRCARPQ